MRRRILLLSLIALVSVGLTLGVTYAAKKPPVTGPCPSPAKGCLCYDLYAPVSCGPNHCTYSNQCVAGCAGWQSSQCTSQGGPFPVE
jgi:hypothetical protein